MAAPMKMATSATSPAEAADAAIAGLEPATLWRFFRDLTQLPRPSKHETRVLEYLKAFADQRKLSWKQDAVGNIVIRRPGSGGGEGAPPVVLQGHVDVVCEKASHVQHDFHVDPLVLLREGDWLKANGTTLGADNGIGVAAALALLDLPPSVKLPPLEALFTVDEETGLTGAFQVAPDLLTGKTMLNLDTETWGEVFIGCAGGGDTLLLLDVGLQAPAAGLAAGQTMSAHTLEVSGLCGGHSGFDIHRCSGNAVQLLGRALGAVAAAAGGDGGWRLAEAAGGDKRNAIARDASAVVLIADSKLPDVAAAVRALDEQLRTEYGSVDTGIALALRPHPGPAPDKVVAPGDASRLLALLRGLPHGVLKMSHAVPGLVETSNNVASLKGVPADDDPAHSNGNGHTAQAQRRRYAINNMTRSALTPALEATRDVLEGLGRLAGCAEVRRSKAYPGWQPNLDSPALKVTLDAYKELLPPDTHIKVSAIHAGLECGILQKKYPGMDCVSYGPTITGAHSPDERVQVSTVEPFWRLTLSILERFADARA